MGARVLVVDDNRTVRRVVRRTLERAGYEIAEAADGREALERAQKSVPDLILLDRVMPNFDGERVCASLAGIANLRDVPVVLMSARVSDLDDALVERLGAADAIKKPFSPEALLAVTAHAIERAAARDESTVPTTPGADPAPAGEGIADAARADAAAAIARALAERLIAPVKSIAGGGVHEDRLRTAIVEEVSQDALFALPAELEAELPGERGEVSFEGRSDHVPLGELMQMLQHQQQSGVLEVERVLGQGPEDAPERVVSICLRAGMVDIALGRGSEREFLLGRYLLEEELVDREDLEMLLKQRGGSRRLLGAQLVKLGYIMADDLRRVLMRQTSELVYEALRWRVARFRFRRWATRPEAQEAKLDLPIASILLEGLRRVDEWRLVEEQIHDFDMKLAVRRDALEAVDDDALSRVERTVLDAVDGERTVREVVEHLGMGSFDACKALFSLMTSGLVREVS